MKKILYPIVAILLLFSCNQIEKKEMNGFVKGKITKFKKDDSGDYSLLIKTPKDSIIVASIMSDDFEPSSKENILQQISIDKEISFKGTIYYFSSGKSRRKSFLSEKREDKTPITAIKEIRFQN